MSLTLMHHVGLMCVLLCAPTTHGAPQPLPPNARRYLNNILTPFAEDFQCIRPNPSLRQFAFMTIGAPTESQLRPPGPPFFRDMDSVNPSYNYFAVVYDGFEHTEGQLILAYNKIVRYGCPTPQNVYIYTYNSPCNECAMYLRQLAIDNDDTNFYISYSTPYGNTLSNTEYHLQRPNIYFGKIEGVCSPNHTGRKRKRSSTCKVITCHAYCSPWGSWGQCSKTCDGGLQFRYRSCVGGSGCCYPPFDRRKCNTQSCPSCFASESMVRVKLLTNEDTLIQRKRMDELKVGDHVESYDRETKSVAFSEVYFISHDGDTDNSSRLLKLVVGSDHGKELSLRLHSKHLVYSCQMRKQIDKATTEYKAEPCCHPPVNPVTAENVKVGDTLWVRNSAGEFSPRPVIEIGEVWSGVRHPMTLNHYIVVDDVLASVHMYDEGLYRQITAPIRFLYGISPSITDTVLVKKLVKLWDSVEDRYL